MKTSKEIKNMKETEIEIIDYAELDEFAPSGHIHTNKQDIWAESGCFRKIIHYMREVYVEGDVIPIIYNEETHTITFLDGGIKYKNQHKCVFHLMK
jgi:hypothetical protein